jgi:hypothetical protein
MANNPQNGSQPTTSANHNNLPILPLEEQDALRAEMNEVIDQGLATMAEKKARIIAMTEPGFSAYLSDTPGHRHHHTLERQWRREAKAGLRKRESALKPT